MQKRFSFDYVLLNVSPKCVFWLKHSNIFLSVMINKRIYLFSIKLIIFELSPFFQHLFNLNSDFKNY